MYSVMRLVVLLALCLAAAPGFAEETVTAVERVIALEDQFGRQHEVVFPRARVSVLALADREGSKQLDGWIEPLHERFGNRVDIFGIARLARVPAVMRPVLRLAFRRAVDHPVMLDWTGEVTDAFDYEAGRLNLLVLAPDGATAFRFHGAVTGDALRRGIDIIDGLLASALHREG